MLFRVLLLREWESGLGIKDREDRSITRTDHGTVENDTTCLIKHLRSDRQRSSLPDTYSRGPKSVAGSP
jgi:hemerythrin superfamily protein